MLSPSVNQVPGADRRLRPRVNADAVAIPAGHGLVFDPALPFRDVLLSPAQVAERLRGSLGVRGALDLRSCTLVRAKYRIGESLRVVYRLDVGGEDHLVSARLFGGTASGGAYERALPAAVAAGPLRPLLHDSALGAVWWSFPNDRRLRSIEGLLHPDAELAGLIGAADVTWAASDVVEYAPERSVTLRATDQDGHTVGYVKAYAPGSMSVSALADRYATAAAALRPCADRLSVPSPLGVHPERNLLLLEAMPGVHWGQLEGEPLRRAMGLLGAAIATVHAELKPEQVVGGARLESLRDFGRLDAARVARSAELVAKARPDVARLALSLGHRLRFGPPTGDEQVVLHGDCHPKNALLTDDRIALIDFDQAGIGVAAADIGSLLARLQHGTLLTEFAEPDADGLAAAFRSGYAEIRPLPSAASIRWHVAACLLVERAMRAVNRVNVPALGRLEPLLEQAHHILDAREQP